MQNSREVIDALLRHRPADRVGLMENIWGDTLAGWVAQGYPANDEGKPVGPAEHFGFDMVGCGGWFDWHARPGFSEIEQETDEWKIVRNGSGAALKWWKNKSGTPEHVDFRMTSRQVWQRDYRPHLVDFDPARVNLDAARDGLARWRPEGRWCFFGHQFLWESMRASLGDLCLYESLLTDPDWIRDVCRVYTDLWKNAFDLLFDKVGLPDGVWIYEDLGYKHRLFCNPDVYRELIFPYYAELVAFIHERDLPVILHTCGFTEPALELIVEAGFDGLHPMEVKAGNDPLRIADRVKDDLALVGGLDARVLESGDRELIRRETARLIDGMKSRGARYVFASDHSLSTNIDYDDYRFALDVYREHRDY